MKTLTIVQALIEVKTRCLVFGLLIVRFKTVILKRTRAHDKDDEARFKDLMKDQTVFNCPEQALKNLEELSRRFQRQRDSGHVTCILASI
jgi:hypothetical protein